MFADRQRVLRTVVDATTGESCAARTWSSTPARASALDYFPGARPRAARYADQPLQHVHRLGPTTACAAASPTRYADPLHGPDADGELTPLRRRRRRDAALERLRARPRANWDYPRAPRAARATPGRTCPVARLHVERPPTIARRPGVHRRAQQLAAQPQPSGHPGALLRQPLPRPPARRRRIGFDAASGELREDAGAIAVHAQFDDGASTAAVVPRPVHVNNASMFTLPDGLRRSCRCSCSPAATQRAQRRQRRRRRAGRAARVHARALEPARVLRRRRLRPAQQRPGRRHGRGLERLVHVRLPRGRRVPGRHRRAGPARAGRLRGHRLRQRGVRLPGGVGLGRTARTAATPTATSARSPACGPEVHADGEIWMQTLWDLRTRLIGAHGRADGITRARRLVTGGMRRSPGRAGLPRHARRDPGHRRPAPGRQRPHADPPGVRSPRDGRLRREQRRLRHHADRELQRHRLRVQRRAAGRRLGGRLRAVGAALGATQPRLLSDIGFGGFPGRRTSLRRVLRRGLAGRISCDADCGFRAALVLPRRSARKARFRGRNAGRLARQLQRRRRGLGAPRCGSASPAAPRASCAA